MQDILVGLLRLRRCGRNTTCPELVGKCSIVRELHVYGTAVPVHGRDTEKLQHQVLELFISYVNTNLSDHSNDFFINYKYCKKFLFEDRNVLGLVLYLLVMFVLKGFVHPSFTNCIKEKNNLHEKKY